MVSKRILTTAISCIGLGLIVLAGGVMAGELTVRSDPQGAQVTLTGDLVVSGITPAVFDQPLIGDYLIEVQKYGYEKYRSRMVLDPSKASSLDIRLNKKTRTKAVFRSILIPGWGQRYSSQKTKGFMYTLLAATSVVGYVIADSDFDDKRDLFEKKRSEFDEASQSGSYDQLVRLHGELTDFQQDAYDAETLRRFTIGAVIASWGLSLLDTYVFFPEERGTFSVKSLSLAPEIGQGESGLKLSLRF